MVRLQGKARQTVMMKPGDQDCNTGKRVRHRTAFPEREECGIWPHMIDYSLAVGTCRDP